MTFSINAENTFDKIQHSFIIKTLNKISIEKTFLNKVKIIYEKPKANITNSKESLKAFLLRSGTRRIPILTASIQHNSRNPS